MYAAPLLQYAVFALAGLVASVAWLVHTAFAAEATGLELVVFLAGLLLLAVAAPLSLFRTHPSALVACTCSALLLLWGVLAVLDSIRLGASYVHLIALVLAAAGALVVAAWGTLASSSLAGPERRTAFGLAAAPVGLVASYLVFALV